jgi:steroid delta-isomerase-like uncharacterized protein
MSDSLSVINRFIAEYQTAGDEAAAEELLARDFVDHTPFPGFGKTRDDVKRLFAVLRSAFPDLRAEVLDQIVDGDRVATRKNFHGTHRGDFLGMPATGRSVTVRVMDIVRISEGKIAEHWNVVGVVELLGQLAASSPTYT